MLNKRTYTTADGCVVTMHSSHILDIWGSLLSIHPRFIAEAYNDALKTLPNSIRWCFTEELPVLHIPFVVKNPKDIDSYPEWCVCWCLESFDEDGYVTTLVVSRLYQHLGILVEKELDDIVSKLNWEDLSEPKVVVDECDHFGVG